MDSCIYTIDIFERIKLSDDYISYELSEEIISKIKSLDESSFNNVTQKNRQVKGFRRNKSAYVEKDPNFKVTNMGVLNRVSDIRNALNKLSEKNYTHQKDFIENTLKTSNEEELKEMGELYVKIASNNGSMSKLYVTLMKETENDMLRSHMDSYIEEYISNISKIKYVDSNENFDDFCEYNKFNDKMKNGAYFIKECCMQNMISKDFFIEFILKIKNTLLSWCNNDTMTNEVEELFELLYILHTGNNTELYEDEVWKTNIYNFIELISKMKKSTLEKGYIGLSSRSIFRAMDLIDMLDI